MSLSEVRQFRLRKQHGGFEMTCSIYGFKSKQDLIKAINQSIEDQILETSIFGPEFQRNGKTTIVGPSPHQRNWFATITCVNGVLVEVK